MCIHLYMHASVIHGHTVFRLSMTAPEPSSRSTTSLWLFCTATWRAPSSWNQVNYKIIIAEILVHAIFKFLHSAHPHICSWCVILYIASTCTDNDKWNPTIIVQYTWLPQSIPHKKEQELSCSYMLKTKLKIKKPSSAQRISWLLLMAVWNATLSYHVMALGWPRKQRKKEWMKERMNERKNEWKKERRIWTIMGMIFESLVATLQCIMVSAITMQTGANSISCSV